MDSGEVVKRDWGWLPRQMPAVAKLMRDKRAVLGNAWVNRCWHHGVVLQQPGWFWASEGGLSVGTPWREVLDVACARVTPTQAVLIVRDKDADDGAH